MGSPRHRRSAPVVELLEGRDLLSSGLTIALTARPAIPPGAVVAAGQAHSAATGGTGAGGGGGGSGGGSAGGAAAPAPIAPGQGTPTPHEVARERFYAVFNGPFVGGPGRFSDQARILYLRGVGSSRFFLHGDYQMAIITPTDASRPITGVAVLEDKNNNSSGIVAFDVVADPSSLDHAGRPTRLTFTGDPNIYSGIFFINTSSGTVRVSYHNGVARAVFQGSVYTSGLTSPLRNSDLVGRGGRVHRR